MKEIVDVQPAVAAVMPDYPEDKPAPGSDGAQLSEDEAKERMRIAEAALNEAVEEMSSDAGGAGDKGGPVLVDPDLSKSVDPMVAAASVSEGSGMDLSKGPDGGLPKVEVTDDEKERFIEAVVACRRYEAPFSVFGGRVTGVLRSRRTVESEAIDSYMKYLVREEKIMTNTEYSDTVRLCLLVACVKEMNGVEYPEMFTKGSGKPFMDYSSGEAVLPEWTERIAYWNGLPESLVSTLSQEIAVFESKYWTMTMRARDENFWLTGGSTEG